MAKTKYLNRKRKRVEEGQSSGSPQQESPTIQEVLPIPTEHAHTVRFNKENFISIAKFQRYEEICAASFITERNVVLPPDKYLDFQDELDRRKWRKLASLPELFNQEVVKIFYANAYPTSKEEEERRVSYIQNTNICYDRDTINAYLGSPLVLRKGRMCEYQKRKAKGVNKVGGFQLDEVRELLCLLGKSFDPPNGPPKRIPRDSMKPLTQMWNAFLKANMWAVSHTSDLALAEAFIVYSIMKGLTVDIAKIISDRIHHKRNSKKGPFIFPSLINELCKHHRVDVPNHNLGELKSPIDAVFIKNHCKAEGRKRRAQPAQQQQEVPPPPPPQDQIQQILLIQQQMQLQQTAMSTRQENMCSKVEEIHAMLTAMMQHRYGHGAGLRTCQIPEWRRELLDIEMEEKS